MLGPFCTIRQFIQGGRSHDQGPDFPGQAETITEGPRALELFTDRHSAIRLFLAYLHESPPREKILFFHGDGGNGKSLLLRFLRLHCCKHLHPKEWEYVKTVRQAPLDTFLQRTAGLAPLPYIHLDFGMHAHGSERPQDPFAALLMLRRQLARYQMRLPLFDFACVWYLRETGQLTSERLHSLFSAEEMDVLAELIDALNVTSYALLAKAVLNLANKHLRERFTLYQYQRKLDETQVATICQMEAHTDLLDALPRFFAIDLNTLMTLPEAPARLVFFFDTHEAFWGVHERESSRDWFFRRDEWLRQLLRLLNRTQGIVVVGAGRDKPRWAQASRLPITEIDMQEVGYLPSADAGTYLEQAGISNAAMRTCLVQYAQIKSGQIHPFYLGLCADVVLTAIARGVTLPPEDFHTTPELEGRATELLDRLLRYADTHVEEAVRALSACRAFNQDIYMELGHRLHLQATRSAFQVLCTLSFVWQEETRAAGWYRIHDLVRQLLHQREDVVTREAHQVLELYYRDQAAAGDPTLRAEAIYHANHLDWERGIQEWIKVFVVALSHSDYEFCRILLEVRNVLTIETKVMLGHVSHWEGTYFLQLAQYEKARQEFTEAIAAYDTALSHAPDDVEVHNNKGLVLLKLGDVQKTLAQYTAAITNYQAAIAAYDTALGYAPNHINVHNNKGRALVRLGDVQATLEQHTAAIASYQAAIAACDTALGYAPNHIDVHNHKGSALLQLGNVQKTLAQHTDAIASYHAAIAAYDTALGYAPDAVEVRNNKGLVLLKLGDVQKTLAQYTAAIASYHAAIAAYDTALGYAPDAVEVHNNKGLVLLSLGDMQKTLAQHTDAIASYHAAISAYDTALGHAPDHVEILDNKGNALLCLGDVQETLAQYPAAIVSFEAAIAVYSQCLVIAPHNTKIRYIRDRLQEILHTKRQGPEV